MQKYDKQKKNINNKFCFKINIIIYEIQVLITTKKNNNLIKKKINEREGPILRLSISKFSNYFP